MPWSKMCHMLIYVLYISYSATELRPIIPLVLVVQYTIYIPFLYERFPKNLYAITTPQERRTATRNNWVYTNKRVEKPKNLTWIFDISSFFFWGGAGSLTCTIWPDRKRREFRGDFVWFSEFVKQLCSLVFKRICFFLSNDLGCQ